MRNLFLITLLFLASCATLNAVEWGPWKMSDVESSKRVWRRCDLDHDGEQYARKGECYQSQECRTGTTILRNTRTECRPLILFCAWGDLACMDKYNTMNMVIVNKEKIR